MLTIDMLPGRHGDALWIEYGTGDTVRRVLIDGGTAGTRADLRRKLSALPPEERHFELLVVTHVDADHIDGVLRLLEDDALAFTVGDVWFNAWRHLPDSVESFGPVAGEKLSVRIDAHGLPWNTAFGGGAVAVRPAGGLTPVTLAGGLRVTVLSPGVEQLRKLKPYWQAEVEEAGLAPGFVLPPEPPAPAGIEVFGGAMPDVAALAATPFHEDDSPANGSSIALLVEFGGKRVLLSGDAFPSVLERAFNRLVGPAERVELHAFKLPHHGSRANVSTALLSRVRCPRYLISTSGSRFHHPDPEAVARVITTGGDRPEVCFNYRSDETAVWESPALQQIHGYTAQYPPAGGAGLHIEL